MITSYAITLRKGLFSSDPADPLYCARIRTHFSLNEIHKSERIPGLLFRCEKNRADGRLDVSDCLLLLSLSSEREGQVRRWHETSSHEWPVIIVNLYSLVRSTTDKIGELRDDKIRSRTHFSTL